MSTVAKTTSNGKTIAPMIRPTRHSTLFDVQSFTEPETWYRVFVNGVEAKCNCPAYVKNKGEEECKHIKAVRRSLTGQQDENTLDESAAPQLEADTPTPLVSTEHHTPTTIPRDFIVNIHGKDFVAYQGLLAMAHERGLVSLTARFISVNDRLALAEATATYKDGRQFTECADASPGNVNEMIKMHFPRMALTRAKARALRDSLNIGLVAVEELG